MTGKCEDCAKKATCKKEIGFMFGYCNIDFEPAITTKPCNIVCYDKEDKLETIEFLRAYNIPFEVSGYGTGYYFAITCTEKEYEIIQAFCNYGTVYRVTAYYDSMFRGVAENHDTIYEHAAIETAIEYANKGYYVKIQSPENMTGDLYTPDEILERWL